LANLICFLNRSFYRVLSVLLLKGALALKIGIIGWRGMVGSVLMQRMREERDLDGLEAHFFSTSNVGGEGPDVGDGISTLKDARDTKLLIEMDAIVTCQGGGYTSDVYPRLRGKGWRGYWIDAASTLRLEKDARIILDPVNRGVIDNALQSGIKTYIGGNCTVSLMLMALGGLFHADLIEWVSSMTYQAASGAGAANMRELVAQMAVLGGSSKALLDDPASSALELDRKVLDTLHSAEFPVENFGVPLAASLIPWIDRPMELGQTREEWKGYVETNRILGLDNNPVVVDGVCVRIGAMRCHAQGFTIKLKQNVPLGELVEIIGKANKWVKVVENTKEATLKELTPAAVSGTLQVPIGRLRKMRMGDDYLGAFSVGDQLLWGAAEPLRRMLCILKKSVGLIG
jgi:aspartate-semialdehyde dehydrogenase